MHLLAYVDAQLSGMQLTHFYTPAEHFTWPRLRSYHPCFTVQLQLAMESCHGLHIWDVQG